MYASESNSFGVSKRTHTHKHARSNSHTHTHTRTHTCTKARTPARTHESARASTRPRKSRTRSRTLCHPPPLPHERVRLIGRKADAAILYRILIQRAGRGGGSRLGRVNGHFPSAVGVRVCDEIQKLETDFCTFKTNIVLPLYTVLHDA